MVVSPSTQHEDAKPAQVTNIYINWTISKDGVDFVIGPMCYVKQTKRIEIKVCSRWIIYITLYWCFLFFSATIQCLLLSCSLCRHLSPVWSGWWLCMTLLGIQTATCPFNREIISWSASILMPSGAAAGSMAERAFSPGLLLRAAQVWSPRHSDDEMTACLCICHH